MQRIDLRKVDELRKIKLERNFIKYAEGSCFVEWGQTKVLTSASVEKTVPLFLKGQNIGWVSAEYSMFSRASQIRLNREKISGRNIEIQRFLGRCLRSVIDLKLLGERTVYIDCEVLQADGGTRMASLLGGFVSLVDCLVSLKEDREIEKIPLKNFLAGVSVGIWKKEFILDLNFFEDSEADVDMNIVMKDNGDFIEIQGCAEKDSFSYKDLERLISLAQKGILELVDLERNILKDVLELCG